MLVSGGLDSATVLAIARAEGRRCHTLTFDYGQRHRVELRAAGRVAGQVGAASHRVLGLDLSLYTGSALTGDVEVPKDRGQDEIEGGIPVTYVPARNLVFLSIAAGYAETVGACEIWIGVNAIDYSGYPDCRPEFIESFERTLNLATKAGVESSAGSGSGSGGGHFRVRTPLAELTKAEIIGRGTALGVDYALTSSCYDPADGAAGGLACGRCDSCLIRRAGFDAAGVPDPTRYAPASI